MPARIVVMPGSTYWHYRLKSAFMPNGLLSGTEFNFNSDIFLYYIYTNIGNSFSSLVVLSFTQIEDTEFIITIK